MKLRFLLAGAFAIGLIAVAIKEYPNPLLDLNLQGDWLSDVQGEIGATELMELLETNIGQDVIRATRELESMSPDDKGSYMQWALKQYELLQLKKRMILELGLPAHNGLSVNNHYQIAEMKTVGFDWEYRQTFPFTDDESAIEDIRNIAILLDENYSESEILSYYNVFALFFGEQGVDYIEDTIYYFDKSLSVLNESLDKKEPENFIQFANLALEKLRYLKNHNLSEEVLNQGAALIKNASEWPVYSGTDLPLALADEVLRETILALTYQDKFNQKCFDTIEKKIFALDFGDSQSMLNLSLLSDALKEYGQSINHDYYSDTQLRIAKLSLVTEFSESDLAESELAKRMIDLGFTGIFNSVKMGDFGAIRYQSVHLRELMRQVRVMMDESKLDPEIIQSIEIFESQDLLGLLENAAACIETSGMDCEKFAVDFFASRFFSSLHLSDAEESVISFSLMLFKVFDGGDWSRENYAKAKDVYLHSFLDNDSATNCDAGVSIASGHLNMANTTLTGAITGYLPIDDSLAEVVTGVRSSAKTYASLANEVSCEDKIVEILIEQASAELAVILLNHSIDSPFIELTGAVEGIKSAVPSPDPLAKLKSVDKLLHFGFVSWLEEASGDVSERIFRSSRLKNKEAIEKFVNSCAIISRLLGSADCVSLLPAAHSMLGYGDQSQKLHLSNIKATQGVSNIGESINRISELQDESEALAQDQSNVSLSSDSISEIVTKTRDALAVKDELLSTKTSVEEASSPVGQMLNARIADLKTIQDSLHDDEVLIFVFPESRAFPLRYSFNVIGIIDSEGFRVKTFDSATANKKISSVLDSIAMRAPFDYEAAFAIYDGVFGDVVISTKTSTQPQNITFIGSGSFNSIPLRLLVVDNPQNEDFNANNSWAYQRLNFRRAASLTSFLSSRTLNTRTQALQAFLGVGNPALASSRTDLRGLKLVSAGGTIQNTSRLNSLPSLPDTETEIRELAGYYLSEPQSTLLFGKDASETQLNSLDLRQYGAIAFATHGLLSSDIPGLDEPALVLSPPNQPSLIDDGLLTASEISEMDMRANLVILSACNTNVEDLNSGSALTNLSNAFMLAGASSIMATHWSVESNIATFLTTRTISRLKNRPADGLAGAVNHAIGLAREKPEWQHPFFWAPFSVYGDNALIN